MEEILHKICENPVLLVVSGVEKFPIFSMDFPKVYICYKTQGNVISKLIYKIENCIDVISIFEIIQKAIILRYNEVHSIVGKLYFKNLAEFWNTWKKCQLKAPIPIERMFLTSRWYKYLHEPIPPNDKCKIDYSALSVSKTAVILYKTDKPEPYNMVISFKYGQLVLNAYKPYCKKTPYTLLDIVYNTKSIKFAVIAQKDTYNFTIINLYKKLRMEDLLFEYICAKKYPTNLGKLPAEIAIIIFKLSL